MPPKTSLLSYLILFITFADKSNTKSPHRLKSLDRKISFISLAAAGLTPHRFRSNNPRYAGKLHRLSFRILRNTEKKDEQGSIIETYRNIYMLMV